MVIKDVILATEKKRIRTFLSTFDLVYEEDIDETIALYEDETLIATASTAEHIIKCVAILPSYQGQSYLATLITELLKRLSSREINHVFVYTKTNQEPLFESLGFKRIVRTNTLSVLERGASIKDALTTLKDAYNLNKEAYGCVVVNANPMTLGHLHLIQTAAKKCDDVLVFVVSENRSFFPFKDRFAIVKSSCQSLSNVTVLPSLEYLVSFATFPKYFLKNESVINKEHALIDVLTFKKYYKDLFNITTRFVGDEPFSPMTNIYNETMKEHLNDQLVIIPRKTFKGAPISASTVRKCLKDKDVESVKAFVTEASYEYLLSDQGQKVIEAIKHEDRRH